MSLFSFPNNGLMNKSTVKYMIFTAPNIHHRLHLQNLCLTWQVWVESVYHEWVMDRSHVLRLGSHVIDMFHRCWVVKNTDLQRRDKHHYPQGKRRRKIISATRHKQLTRKLKDNTRRCGMNDSKIKAESKINCSTWREECTRVGKTMKWRHHTDL